MVPHKAHGEEEVDDGEDGVQPKEVIAKEEITCCQGWASQQKGQVAGLGSNHSQWIPCQEPIALPLTDAM